MLPCVNIAGPDNNFIGVYLSSNPQLLFLTWRLTGSTRWRSARRGPNRNFAGIMSGEFWLRSRIVWVVYQAPQRSCSRTISVLLASRWHWLQRLRTCQGSCPLLILGASAHNRWPSCKDSVNASAP